MSEDINCYAKMCGADGKPKKPSQEDTRAKDGKHQTVKDWMRNGGKKPDVTIR